MSFFDAIRRFFKPTPEEKAESLQKKITNMYVHQDDRRYALGQLHDLGPELAPARLIQRFTCQCDNLTYDSEEKEYTKSLLVDLGSASIPVLEDFLRKNDRDFSWPYRTLSELLSHDSLVEFILELLNDIGPEYTRYTERKEQLMLTVKSFDEDCIKLAVLPYLGDQNETIRFVCADTVINHQHPKGIEELAKRLGQESSQRVLSLIASAFRDKGWTVPEESRESAKAKLPSEFRLNDKGLIL